MKRTPGQKKSQCRGPEVGVRDVLKDQKRDCCTEQALSAGVRPRLGPLTLWALLGGGRVWNSP